MVGRSAVAPVSRQRAGGLSHFFAHCQCALNQAGGFMAGKVLRLRHLEVVRQMRKGSSIGQVSKLFRLPANRVMALADSFREVPDEVLAHLEYLLSENEKLRRLVFRLLLQFDRSGRPQDALDSLIPSSD